MHFKKLAKTIDYQLFIYVIILSIIFINCKNEANNGNYKVFRYNQANNINSLDPAFAKSQNNMWAVHQLYDGLVALNDSLQLVPRIAKRWDFSEDRKSIKFTLSDKFNFHKNPCFEGNTRKVVADDFVFSFNRIIDDATNSPGSWIFKDIVSDELPFSAPNDSTFVIQLKKAFYPLMGILTMQYCSVVPHEAVSYYGNQFRANPVGSGPFYFKTWRENQGLYLLKNKDYPLQTGNLDGIKVSFIPDKKIAYYELLNQNIDFLSGIESSYANELLDKNGALLEEKSKDLSLLNIPFLNSEYIGINMDLAKSSILGDANLRRALNFAIDREEMLAVLKNNIGEKASAGFVPKGLPNHNPEVVRGYSYNLDSAFYYLNLSSYKSNPEILELHTNSEYVDIMTYVAKSWENIGIKVKINLMESAILRQGMRNGTIPMFRASWIADYPDPESFLCMYYSKNPPPPNYTMFSSDQFDALYELALAETNEDKRNILYWEMEKILIAEAPIIFLYYDETALFTLNRVKNFKANALNLLDTRNINLE